MSPRGFDASQRPFVWIRSRISPSASAVPARLQVAPAPACARTASRRSRSGGRRSTPAKPTSITLRGASTFSPTRKPARKTAAPASSQTGQSGRRRARRPVAARDPDAADEQVDERRVGERRAPEDLALVEEAQRDGEREQREQVEVAQRARPAQVGEPEQEDARRRRARARRVLIVLPPNAPAPPRAIVQATCGPVHASLTAPVRVVDLAEHDLPGVARPRLHDPLVGRGAVLGVGRAGSAGSARASAATFGSRAGCRVACSSVSRARPRRRRERRLRRDGPSSS